MKNGRPCPLQDDRIAWHRTQLEAISLHTVQSHSAAAQPTTRIRSQTTHRRVAPGHDAVERPAARPIGGG